MLVNPLFQVALLVSDGSTKTDIRRARSALSHGAVHPGLSEKRPTHSEVHGSIAFCEQLVLEEIRVLILASHRAFLCFTQRLAGIRETLSTPIRMLREHPCQLIAMVQISWL